eukprot:gb/GECH01011546.1/.p1 GENE.gb/GECH01011546.1/~~gb/GECH01011546.1/.p1  ORF type:complete len:761 (+),score=154.05 gb/GECH01011546.1/:1-2283(+)
MLRSRGHASLFSKSQHLSSYKKHTVPSLSRRGFHYTAKKSRGLTEVIEEMKDPDAVNKKEKEKEYMQRMKSLQFIDDWEFYDDPLSKAFVTKVWKMIRGPEFENSESALELLDASELYQVMRRKYPGMKEEQIREVVRQMIERVEKYRKRKDNIYEYLWRMSNKRAVERTTSRIVGRNRSPYLSMAESFMELLYEPSTVSRQSAQLLLRNDVRGRHLHTFVQRLHDVYADTVNSDIGAEVDPVYEPVDVDDEADELGIEEEAPKSSQEAETDAPDENSPDEDESGEADEPGAAPEQDDDDDYLAEQPEHVRFEYDPHEQYTSGRYDPDGFNADEGYMEEEEDADEEETKGDSSFTGPFQPDELGLHRYDARSDHPKQPHSPYKKGADVPLVRSSVDPEYTKDPPSIDTSEDQPVPELFKKADLDKILKNESDEQNLDLLDIAKRYEEGKLDLSELFPGEMEGQEDIGDESGQMDSQLSSYAAELPQGVSMPSQRSLRKIKSLARKHRRQRDIDEGLLMPLEKNQQDEDESLDEQEDATQEDNFSVTDLENLGALNLDEVREHLGDSGIKHSSMVAQLKNKADTVQDDFTMDSEPLDMLYYAFKPVIEEFIFKEDRPPLPAYIPPRKVDADGSAWGTGRRKESSARVQILPAAGPQPPFIINGRPYNEYFRRPRYLYNLMTPFRLADSFYKFEVRSWVRGGGLTGQSEALRKALADALINYYPTLRPTFKTVGLLRRDHREVERKKTGQEKARKKFTWVKR